ncbi:MAG: hypothetical protein NTW69_17990 [Chloroflexi bacterium]|nr:hypothetical protein [Chloroflexota bacterium]
MRKSPILVTGDFYFRDFAPNSAPNWMPTTPVSTVSPAMNCATRFASIPKEVHGEDFPGETFRVLKDKEVCL